VPSPRQGLRSISLCQSVFALSLVHGCKIRKGVKRARILGTPHSVLDLEGLAEQRLACAYLPWE